ERVRRAVEVHDPAEPAGELDPVHRAPLGPLRQLERAVLRDRVAADEHRVAAAAVRGQQIGVAGAQRPAEEEPGVARGQHHPPVRAARPAERPRPPRRHLLEQRDVPRPARERAGELGGERPPRRRHRPAVEEVPGQDADAGCSWAAAVWTALRYWCTKAIAMLPSPTAAATRLTGP